MTQDPFEKRKSAMQRLSAILAAVLIFSCGLPAQSADELRVETRFGAVTLDSERRLLFRGKLIQPIMQANSGIDAGRPFRIGSSDVMLVTIMGGTACPYLYHFVTVTASGAKGTPQFGTCNQALRVNRHEDSIVIIMHGFRGPFEPPEERRKAFRETHEFIFRNGVVSENGKPVRGSNLPGSRHH